MKKLLSALSACVAVAGISAMADGNVAMAQPVVVAGDVTVNAAVADNTAVAVLPDYGVTRRPAKGKRLFSSKAVEREIERVKGLLTNPKIGRAHV